MFISHNNFRKFIHSIKFLEYEWILYQLRFPKEAKLFQHKKDVESFIANNKYDILKQTITLPLSKKIYLPKPQFLEIKKYQKISRVLEHLLNSKNSGFRPQK